MNRAVLAFVAVVLLAGCASQTDDATRPDEAEATAPASQSPSGTPAEVISRGMSLWQTAIKNGAECRLKWALDEETQGSELCFANEKAAAAAAKLARQDLNSAVAEASTADLVALTKANLELVDSVDISVCGNGRIPVGTKPCTDALASIYSGWIALKPTLEKWEPYL